MAEQPGVDALRYDGAPERRDTILDAVQETGFVSVTDLARRLGVSDMTVRRDLRKLEKQGHVRVVHGGVSSLRSADQHSPAFAGRAGLQAEGKRLIGTTAVAGLGSRATVAVDAGTTTYAAVQALPESYSGTVVTHSVPVMQLLLTRESIHVVGLGGELLQESQAFVGPRTVEATHGLRVETLFLGAAAADRRGVYVSTDNERPTKLALMEIAAEVVLLADSAKFVASAPVLLCGWDRIDRLVTDGDLPRQVREALGRHGTVVQRADEPASATGRQGRV